MFICHTDALVQHMQMHVWFLHCTKVVKVFLCEKHSCRSLQQHNATRGCISSSTSAQHINSKYQQHSGQHTRAASIVSSKHDASIMCWQVDVDSRTMILSERAAIMEDAMDKLKAGDVVEAVVRNLVPYGAFVSIKDPQTSELTGGHVSLLLLMFTCDLACMWFPRNVL